MQDSVSTWTDAGTGGDQHHTAEHGSNPEDTIGGKATDPELGRWVLNDVSGPVTGARDDEGELGPLGLGDGGESVPFLEGGVGNPDGRTGVRAS